MRKSLIVFCSLIICFLFSLGVSAYTVIQQGNFRLTAENQWDTLEKKSYALLKWDAVKDLSQNGYQLYQSEDGKNWVNRSGGPKFCSSDKRNQSS